VRLQAGMASDVFGARTPPVERPQPIPRPRRLAIEHLAGLESPDAAAVLC
jgi:hypothetical protein